MPSELDHRRQPLRMKDTGRGLDHQCQRVGALQARTRACDIVCPTSLWTGLKRSLEHNVFWRGHSRAYRLCRAGLRPNWPKVLFQCARAGRGARSQQAAAYVNMEGDRPSAPRGVARPTTRQGWDVHWHDQFGRSKCAREAQSPTPPWAMSPDYGLLKGGRSPTSPWEMIIAICSRMPAGQGHHHPRSPLIPPSRAAPAITPCAMPS